MCTIKIRDSREDITTQLYNINKSYKHHNTSQGPRGLEYKCSITNESAEATISEYRHKLNKFCIKKASTKVATIEKARPPAWDLLTTPGRRQRPARSSRHLQCRGSRRRRWRL